MSTHCCHVPICDVETPPNMLMCRAHWAMVPLPLKNRIWIEFKEEQVTTKKPSAAYLKAAKEALDAVNEKLVGPPTVQGGYSERMRSFPGKGEARVHDALKRLDAL